MSALDDLALSVAKALPRGGHRFLREVANISPGLRAYPLETRHGRVVCDFRETVCFPLLTHGQPRHWKNLEPFFADLPFAEGATVFDVGANIGLTAMIFAKKAGRVLAFEPAPRALTMLRRNVSAIPNIEVHAVAVSDAPGTVHFSEHDALDCSSMAADGEIAVEAITLDSLGIDADFIKIDVEGFEEQVLRGATRQLERGVPVMFEGHSQAEVDRNLAIMQAANPSYRVRQMLPSKANWLATTEGAAL